MPDGNNDYHKYVVFDLVYDSIHSNADPIPGLARELYAPLRSRFFTQRTNRDSYSFNIRLGKFLDRLLGRTSDFNFIRGHVF